MLHGYDDWANLKYSFRDSADARDGVKGRTPAGGELTLTAALAESGDADSDGVTNLLDDCMTVANADQRDEDDDGVGDVCDVCPAVYNPSQEPCASLPPGGEPDDPGTFTGSADAGRGTGADAGSTIADSGALASRDASAPDAGVRSPDSGVHTDGAATRIDGSIAHTGAPSGGCACTVGGRSQRAGARMAALIVALGVMVRRRRSHPRA